MQGLLKRIWQWIQQVFGQLFGGRSPARVHGSNSEASNRPLTDTDYEFLFSQLLEGVAHGWHEGRILKYFEDLGERGKPKPWIAWLNRFGEKAMASASPNLQLAARMMRLGELAQSFREIEVIGQTSYDIGRRIYSKEADSGIWEYEGPDTDGEIVTTDRPESRLPQGNIPNNQPDAGETQTLTLTLEELKERLEQDTGLAQQLATQLGLQSTEPQDLIDALIAQSQDDNQAQSTTPPETEQEWFNLGMQQASQGDLEGAIASWDKALEINPSLAQGWQNRGSALGNLGRLNEAIDSFDRVIYLNAEDVQAWNSKGNALYGLQQWEGAITCWEKGLELQPNDYQGWYNRGSALEKLNRIEEAIASYRQALDIEPGFELAQSRLNKLSSENES